MVVGTATGAAVTARTTGVAVDATPTDTDEAESTHTVVFTVGAGAESAGGSFDCIRVDYSRETPSADVSNVRTGTIERIGIDRGGDDDGSGGGRTGADGPGFGAAVAATALLLAALVARRR